MMPNQRNGIFLLFLVLILGFLVPMGSFAESISVAQSATDPLILSGKILEQKQINDPTQLDFFFDDGCEACQKVIPLIDNLKSVYPEIRVNSHNVCPDSKNSNQTRDLFETYKRNYALSTAFVPIVFIGDSVVQGDKNVTADLETVIQSKLGIKENSRVTYLPNSSTNKPTPVPDTNGVNFFYDDDCGSCQKVIPLVDTLKSTYPNVKFNYYNICKSEPDGKQNQDIFTAYKQKQGVSSGGVPMIFIGDTVIQTDQKILTDLEPAIQKMQNVSAANATLISNSGGISTPILFLAAIGEGFNPAVLILFPLLLLPLIGKHSRKRMVIVGVTCILTYLCTRLIVGAAVITWISILDIAKIVVPVGAIIAVITGAIHIRDGIAHAQKPLLSIPDHYRVKIIPYFNAATISSGIIVGLFFGFFGLISSGGLYLPVLGMVDTDLLSGIMYVFGYNLIVMIPLIVLLMLFSLRTAPKEKGCLIERKQYIFSLIIGVVALVVGIIILLPKILA